MLGDSDVRTVCAPQRSMADSGTENPPAEPHPQLQNFAKSLKLC